MKTKTSFKTRRIQGRSATPSITDVNIIPAGTALMMPERMWARQNPNPVNVMRALQSVALVANQSNYNQAT
jgi:hypothetical protein